MTVVNVTPPAITGLAKRGQTLSSSQGTWTYSLDYLTYAYQWERCDALGANCIDISSADQAQYVVQAADVGATLRVEVTATEHSGAPPTPPSSFDIPTYQATGNPSGDSIAQTWALYTSPTTPVGHWGSAPARELRSPQSDAVNGSWTWWYLYQIMIPSAWNTGNEGNQYAFPLDLHNVPGDVGWSDVPPASGVSAQHLRYKGGNLLLQHEYNNPNVFTAFTSLSRDVWHSVVGQTIWGRMDWASSPPAGHPNGGMGRTKLWLDGNATPFDTGNITILQKNSNTGNVQKKMTVLDGVYWPGMGAQHIAYFTISRWGRTFAEAQDDSDFTLGGYHTHANLSLSLQTPRTSDDFVAPPGL